MISGVVGGRSSGISNASLVMQLPAFSEGTEFRANEFGECVNHDGVVEVHVRVIIPDRSNLLQRFCLIVILGCTESYPTSATWSLRSETLIVKLRPLS